MSLTYRPKQSEQAAFNRDGSRQYEFFKVTNHTNGMVFIGYSLFPYKKWTDIKIKAQKPNPTFPIERAVKEFGPEKFSFSLIPDINSETKELAKKVAVSIAEKEKAIWGEGGYTERHHTPPPQKDSEETKLKKSEGAKKREEERRQKKLADPTWAPKIYRRPNSELTEEELKEIACRTYYIYKITNTVNGKIYIGQSFEPTERFKSHIKESRLDEPRVAISKAIKKYTPEKFEFHILEVQPNVALINEAEVRWIKQFDSTNRDVGYNVALGGNSGNHTQETKSKIAKGIRQKSIPTVSDQEISDFVDVDDFIDNSLPEPVLLNNSKYRPRRYFPVLERGEVEVEGGKYIHVYKIDDFQNRRIYFDVDTKSPMGSYRKQLMKDQAFLSPIEEEINKNGSDLLLVKIIKSFLVPSPDKETQIRNIANDFCKKMILRHKSYLPEHGYNYLNF